MAETQRFGLTKTADNDIIDRLFAHFEEHRHDGAGADGLADPTDAPTAAVSSTGGTLANGVDLYYRVSFVDANGLETVASDELEVAMPPIPEVSQEPVPTASVVGGSTLSDNTYFYALTANAPAGETALGPQAIITVVPGQNQVDLALPELPDGADSYNVWRMGTGEEGWTKVGEDITASSFSDTGFPSADCPCDPATQPPTDNFGTATNSVTITAPDVSIVGADPSPVLAWRIYRTDTSGVYGDNSLLAQVASTTGESSGGLVTSYVDTGSDLLSGSPNDTSTALHPSRPVVLPHGAALPTDVTGYAAYSPFVLDDGTSRKLYVLVNGQWELLGGGGGTADGVVLTAPDGSTWQLTVDNAGALGTTLLQSGLPFTEDFAPNAPVGARWSSLQAGTLTADANGHIPFGNDGFVGYSYEMGTLDQSVQATYGDLGADTLWLYLGIKNEPTNPFSDYLQVGISANSIDLTERVDLQGDNIVPLTVTGTRSGVSAGSVTVEVVGTAITVLQDGVAYATGTLSEVLRSTQFAFYVNGTGGPGYLDKIVLDEASAPSAPPPDPKAPSGVTVGPTQGVDQLHVNWVAPTASTGPTSYSVTVSKNGAEDSDAAWVDRQTGVAASVTPPATSVELTSSVLDFTYGADYTVTVTAHYADATTATSASSAAYAPAGGGGALVNPPQGAASAVSGLTASNTGSGQITASWTLPTTGNAFGLIKIRLTDSGSSIVPVDSDPNTDALGEPLLPPTATSHVLDGLSPDSYTLAVWTSNSYGSGQASVPVTVA